ncbi:MAG TPA: VWA domain-containing protein [Gaiellaceae bacterium]|nr:VWA domain-containing protein [Gaiellaceae bacterium]
MRSRTIHRTGATPLGELRRLALPARRTTLLRVGIALALAGALALAALSARTAGSGRAAVLPQGASTGVVVVDLSASIAGPVYRRVATTLQGIAVANQSIGLVMFSDVAYELLPPGSPPGALLQFLRFFAPDRVVHGAAIFGASPWDQFSGGTRIAAGLRAGRAALARAHVRHGSLLLVSDLDDSNADREPLYAETVALRRAHIPVRIVPLFAEADNKALFAALFGRDAFVDPSVFRHRAGHAVQTVAATTAWTLLALGAVIVLLLAANERLQARLEPEVAAAGGGAAA